MLVGDGDVYALASASGHDVGPLASVLDHRLARFMLARLGSVSLEKARICWTIAERKRDQLFLFLSMLSPLSNQTSVLFGYSSAERETNKNRFRAWSVPFLY